MPVAVLLRNHRYGTRLSVATAPAHPLSLRRPGTALRPKGLRAKFIWQWLNLTYPRSGIKNIKTS